MNRELVLAEKVVKFEEGLRLKPYYCSEGYPTIGFGEKIGEKNSLLPDLIWTEDQAYAALLDKLNKSVTELSKNKETKAVWESLSGDSDRRAILISMWYQLGITKLSGFKNTLKAILDKDWNKAKDEMLDSLAARQTPKRWVRQSNAIMSGNIISSYNL